MKRMLGSAVLALALVPLSAALAHDQNDGPGTGPLLFVKVDGVAGESVQKGHEDEIEAFNFSETFRLNIPSGGGGGGAGKFTPGPVVFSKLQGRASIGLLRACAKGQHIPQVTITAFRRTGDGRSTPFYKITLKDVFVSAINEKTSGEFIVDEIQLVYESGRWEVFDPPDATEFDGKTGKVSGKAPTGNPR